MSQQTKQDDGFTTCCNSGGSKSACDDSKSKVTTLTDAGIPDIQLYTAVPGKIRPDKSSAIIVCYDIFGFEVANTRKFCDILASQTGLQVIMPDFFRGETKPKDLAPPANKEWVNRVGSWEIVHRDLTAIKIHLEKSGITGKLGIVGFCWGGNKMLKACALEDFGAGVSVHGSTLTTEDAEQVKVPIALLPAGNDPSTEPLKEILDKKSFGARCVYKTFDDMTHGFAAARSDWTNERNVECIKEVLNICTTIFEQNL